MQSVSTSPSDLAGMEQPEGHTELRRNSQSTADMEQGLAKLWEMKIFVRLCKLFLSLPLLGIWRQNNRGWGREMAVI